MTILVTNDDGILADGLWALVRELREIAPVVAIVPDRERSGIGTAVTLYRPLRVHQVRPMVPEVDTYAVEGTPSDCVILGLSSLVKDRITMVVAGINQGANMGDDVLISGTVAAALQGNLRGLPALAISIEATDSCYLDTATRLAALLAGRVNAGALPGNIFLNVNVPDLPLAAIRGITATRLASGTHADGAEKSNDGKRDCYWLVRTRTDNVTDDGTDVGALGRGSISITPLSARMLDGRSPAIPDNLCSGLFQELQHTAGER